MSILIKGMEMPTTGLYFVSVDNTDGRDKTIVTVERMLGNRDVRQIVGSFELAPVPTPHGKLIDADVFESIKYELPDGQKAFNRGFHSGVQYVQRLIMDAPTILEAEEGE